MSGVQTGINEMKCIKDEMLKMNLTLQGSPKKSSDLPNFEMYSVALKEAITRQTAILPKGIDLNTVKTDNIFTNLTIRHGRKEILHPKRSQEVDQSAIKTVIRIMECREIFEDENEENNPKSILVSGEPGIGKTLFSQKIVRDWSTNSVLIPDIRSTYLLTFRQLVRLGNKELTLRDLLNHSPLLNERTMITEEIMEYIIQHPDQLLVVIDGLDEYKEKSKIIGDFEEPFPNDVRIKMPVAALVSKLMRKKVLSESVIMITSRPSEANALDQKIHVDRYVNITGFSEAQVLEYVEKYFKSKPEKVKKLAVGKVKGSAHHISFGRAPFRCFLMCIFVEWEIKNKFDDLPPATLTEFYCKVIRCIERNYNRVILSLDEKTASVAVDKAIDNFSQLAVHLSEHDRYSFISEDLDKLNIKESELLFSSNLISCYPVSSNIPFQKTTLEYSFTHFTIHEFFVAWYLVKKGALTTHTTTDMVYIFMSGLLGLNNNDSLMLELLKCLSKHFDDEDRLRLVSLRCLHEYGQDKILTRQELITNRDYKYWNSRGEIELIDVTDTDCAVIGMLVETTATSMSSWPPHVLFIHSSSLTGSGLNTLLPSLTQANCKITVLVLFGCDLDDACADCLCQYLKDTKITELNLSTNELSDIGLNHILNHLLSNLSELNLTFNSVSDEYKKKAKKFCKDYNPLLRFYI